jgi:hypothetical protein
MFTWTCKGCFRPNQWYLPKCVHCDKPKPTDHPSCEVEHGK